MNEFNSDYEAMANSLQVMNKRLVLLNPVSEFFLSLNYGNDLEICKLKENIYSSKWSGKSSTTRWKSK